MGCRRQAVPPRVATVVLTGRLFAVTKNGGVVPKSLFDGVDGLVVINLLDEASSSVKRQACDASLTTGRLNELDFPFPLPFLFQPPG